MVTPLVSSTQEHSSKRRRIQGDDEPGTFHQQTTSQNATLYAEVTNEYIGHVLDKDSSVEEVAPNYSRNDFFHRFISKRRPCILKGHPPFAPSHNTKSPQQESNSSNSSGAWAIKHPVLVNAAGKEMVQVERRFNTNESFGQARTKERQVTMTFEEFLDKVTETSKARASSCKKDPNHDNETAAAGEMLYLSTQEVADEDGYEDDPMCDKKGSDSPLSTTITAPCRQLIEHGVIPSQLNLTGNLVLHACNLWMGNTQSGSSSGLHHDYHDNIYVLLRGQKRFRLYSPDVSQRMYVHGTFQRIYPNGLISYKGRETREDGVPLVMIRGMQGNLDNEGGHDDEDDEEEEEFVFGKGANYESSDNENSNPGDDDWDSDREDDFDILEHDGANTNDQDKNLETKQNSHQAVYLDSNTDKKLEAKNDQDGEVGDTMPPQPPHHCEEDAPPPPSFSRLTSLDLRDLDHGETESLRLNYPEFVDCPSVQIELKAGESLYLPAGWFHEVVSTNESTKDDDTTCGIDPLNNCHLAVNYWYYPPDNLTNFDKPYKSDVLTSNHGNLKCE
jgi:hypothetical protein